MNRNLKFLVIVEPLFLEITKLPSLIPVAIIEEPICRGAIGLVLPIPRLPFDDIVIISVSSVDKFEVLVILNALLTVS
jgi:hypothetical protein